MTEQELAEIRAAHTCRDLFNSTRCKACGDTWPCEDARLVAEVERLRAHIERATGDRHNSFHQERDPVTWRDCNVEVCVAARAVLEGRAG